MRQLKFSLPLVSIFQMGIGILMLFAFLAIFDALRFIQCSSWVSLPPPPENIVVLLGTFRNILYVKTTSTSAYCFDQGQWSSCLLPPYELRPAFAPSWLNGKLEANFQNRDLLQVIRSDGFSEIHYYSLLTDGHLFACSTAFSTEVEHILWSGGFLWLLIPVITIIWSAISFFHIFVKHGQPTLWDFWGRGERIK